MIRYAIPILAALASAAYAYEPRNPAAAIEQGTSSPSIPVLRGLITQKQEIIGSKCYRLEKIMGQEYFKMYQESSLTVVMQIGGIPNRINVDQATFDETIPGTLATIVESSYHKHIPIAIQPKQDIDLAHLYKAALFGQLIPLDQITHNSAVKDLSPAQPRSSTQSGFVFPCAR